MVDPTNPKYTGAGHLTLSRRDIDTRMSIASHEEKLRDKRIEPPPPEGVEQQSDSAE
jgi:hypothetical protein